MRVLGVDGCRGGWLVADVADGVRWWWTESAAAVLAEPATAIGIDIPIGLPESGQRACDVAARALVGARRSSVFPAPPRCVLATSSYAEARALLASRGSTSMSAQAYGIVRAVADVDAVFVPSMEDRVIEAHPEGAFAVLGGALPSKRTADGVAARIAALERVYPDAPSIVAAAPRPARPDDACDALACAWTAARWLAGEADELGDGSRDARGLLMRIVVPRDALGGIGDVGRRPTPGVRESSPGLA